MNTLENALALHQGGDLPRAIAAYEEALRHDPCNTVTLNNLGVALCEMQQYDKGITVFAEVLKHEPNDAETYFNLGNAYLLTGNVPVAIGTLHYASRLAPDDKEIQDALAEATAKLEKLTSDSENASTPATSSDSRAAAFDIGIPEISQRPINLEEPARSEKPREKSKATFYKPIRTSSSKSHEWFDIFQRVDKIEELYKHYGFDAERDKLIDKRRHLTDPDVLIFIIGEGNFGKSSLINALLGREVADVSRQPKTWRIDLYRSQDSGREEFAEVRRYGYPDAECFSIQDAEALCNEQEEEVIARAEDARAAHEQGEQANAHAAAFHGQIIEVNWYYRDLSTDPNIVLVDTPGFAQFRLGLNDARARTISSHRGVVFDIGETYEHYYSHADLVLWAFRANKINDQDTINAIKDLSQYEKPITGILTNFDRVPPNDRDETVKMAKGLYGTYAADFVSVIAGGKSEERGLGIPELRSRISEVSRTASIIKLQSGHDYCNDAARFGNQWLKSIGDALIRNVSEVAQYCNATSDKLLRDTYLSQQSCLDEFQKRITSRSGSAAFQAFLLNVIESRSTKEYQHQQITDYLKVDTLRAQMQTQLDQVGKYLVVQGQKEARTHRLQQVIVKATGRTETRPLEAIIEPPDVSHLGLSLEGVILPEVVSGFMDGLLEVFDGSFLGAVASFFGGRSKEERQKEAVLKADDQIQTAVKNQITDAAKGYVKAGARAILATAENGLSKLYDGKGFAELQKEADYIDRDMKQMSKIVGEEAGEDVYYRSLFRLWSPVDDARNVAIEMFLRWFREHQTEMQDQAKGWLVQATDADPLPDSLVASCCRTYLQETKQTLQLRKRISLREIKSERQYGLSLAALFDGIGSWLTSLHENIAKQRLFDDNENFLLASFKHFNLSGLSEDFTDHLRYDFLDNSKKQFDLGYSLQTTHINFSESFEWFQRLARPSFYGTSLGAGIVAGCYDKLDLHAATLWLPIVSAIATSLAGATLLFSVQYHLWRSRKRIYVSSKFIQTVEMAISQMCQAQWTNTVNRITPNLARQIIGQRTLVKKRPLEYAQEGALDAYAKQDN